MNSLRRPSPAFFRFAKSQQVFICLLDRKFYEFNKELQPQLAKSPDKSHLKKHREWNSVLRIWLDRSIQALPNNHGDDYPIDCVIYCVSHDYACNTH